MTGLLISASLGCARSDWIQFDARHGRRQLEWQGNVTRSDGAYGPDLIYLRLRQSGPKVTGTFSFSPGPTKDVLLEGMLSGDVLRFCSRGGAVTAELQVNGEAMSGTATAAAGPVKLEIHRQP